MSYFLGVSEDEVQRGLASCYTGGLTTLNVVQTYEYRCSTAIALPASGPDEICPLISVQLTHSCLSFRSAVAFVSQIGFSEFARSNFFLRTPGPVQISGIHIGGENQTQFKEI